MLPLIPGLVYLWANGPTVAGGALLSIPLLMVLLGMLKIRAARFAFAAVVLLDVTWVAARLWRDATLPEGVEVDGGWFWQRIAPEHEAARAGLYVAGITGSMRGAEFRAFDRLLDAKYGALPPAWRAMPNALLMFSTPSHVQSLRWMPPGAEPVRCFVFLHGFGGELTPYLKEMVDAKMGGVVAPVLDSIGWWPSARGRAVVAETVRRLPARCDRKRLYLVGLSNGSVGASALMASAEERAPFRGAILVSGAGREAVDQPKATRWLFISGAQDPRFPISYIEGVATDLRATGAAVKLAPFEDADHFLILTHGPRWTSLAADWACQQEQ